MIAGKQKIVAEKYRDDWYILNISADVSENDGFLYACLVLINEKEKLFISVSGTDSIQVLKKELFKRLSC